MKTMKPKPITLTKDDLVNLTTEHYNYLKTYALNILAKFSLKAKMIKGEDIACRAVANFVKTYNPEKGTIGGCLYFAVITATRDSVKEDTGIHYQSKKKTVPLYLESEDGTEYLNPALTSYCYIDNTLDNLIQGELDEIKKRELAIIRQAITIFEKTNAPKKQDGKLILHQSNFKKWFSKRIKTREQLTYLASLKSPNNKRDSLWYDASRQVLMGKKGKGAPRKRKQK